MVVLDKVTDLLLFFGKLLVVGGVGKGPGAVGTEGRCAGQLKRWPQRSSTNPQNYSTGVLSFFFFSGRIQGLGRDFKSPHLNYYWLPIMVSDSPLCRSTPNSPKEPYSPNGSCVFQTSIVGAYVIASGFFSVFGMCVDTLFLCFRE